MWAEAACGCLGPALSLNPPPPSVHPSLPPQLHSEGLANMNMLTYMIRVGPRAFRGKTASVLSSPLSLNSVMTAGWLKYTEGLNHLRPYKSYERDPPPLLLWGQEVLVKKRGKQLDTIWMSSPATFFAPCSWISSARIIKVMHQDFSPLTNKSPIKLGAIKPLSALPTWSQYVGWWPLGPRARRLDVHSSFPASTSDPYIAVG